MREFAKATVRAVEEHFDLPRGKWEDTSQVFADDALVRFFIEDPETAGGLVVVGFHRPIML